MPQHAVWREAISRGGGNNGKPATVHHLAPFTLIVSGELQDLPWGEVGGSVAEHARKQARDPSISLSNKRSPMGSSAVSAKTGRYASAIPTCCSTTSFSLVHVTVGLGIPEATQISSASSPTLAVRSLISVISGGSVWRKVTTGSTSDAPPMVRGMEAGNVLLYVHRFMTWTLLFVQLRQFHCLLPRRKNLHKLGI